MLLPLVYAGTVTPIPKCCVVVRLGHTEKVLAELFELIVEVDTPELAVIAPEKVHACMVSLN
jgi:hypothetical protein